MKRKEELNEREQLSDENLSEVSGGVSQQSDKLEPRGDYPGDSYEHEYGGNLPKNYGEAAKKGDRIE